jgi:phosphohistidine swiveling domain-containing protein
MLGAGADTVGQLASDLIKLQASDVRIVTSVVLTADLLRVFQDTDSVPTALVDQLIDTIRAGDFRNNRDVLLRVSVARAYNGLEDKIRVRKTFAPLKAAIERIYRSWSGDRARASRIIHSLADSNSIPTLLVQPWLNKLTSLGTRDPVSGQLTNQANFRSSPDSQPIHFTGIHALLAKRVDNALHRPVEVYFICHRSDLIVADITDELMTTAGTFGALRSYLSNGVIDDLEFLKRVDPSAIGYLSSYELSSSDRMTIDGIAASHGIVHGKLIFRDSKTIWVGHQPLILLVPDSLSPEDISFFRRCEGGIGIRGGQTSHLAVVSRGLNKPAVVGCGGEFDARSRSYRLPDGDLIPEFNDVILDGSNGRVAFSASPLFEARYTKNPAIAEFAELLCGVVAKIRSNSEFGKLAISDQWHVAELSNRLRKVGLVQ